MENLTNEELQHAIDTLSELYVMTCQFEDALNALVTEQVQRVQQLSTVMGSET